MYQTPHSYLYNQLVMIDEAGSHIKELFPQKASMSGVYFTLSNSFQEQGNDKYFSPQFGDTIYKWDGAKEWKRFMTLSFGNKTFTGNVYEYLEKYSVMPGDPDFPYLARRDFSVFSNFLMVDFLIDSKPYCCFYDLKTGKTKTGKVKNDLIPDYEDIFPTGQNRSHGNQTGNFFVEFIQPECIINENHKGLCKLDKSLENIKEDDNPVLLIYEFK